MEVVGCLKGWKLSGFLVVFRDWVEGGIKDEFSFGGMYFKCLFFCLSGGEDRENF